MKKIEAAKAFAIIWCVISSFFMLSVLALFLILSMIISSDYTMELLEESVSPNGDFTARLYFHLSGGAAGTVSLRGYVTNNITEQTHPIYKSFRRGNFSVDWIDNVTVAINGIELNAISDSYGDVPHK